MKIQTPSTSKIIGAEFGDCTYYLTPADFAVCNFDIETAMLSENIEIIIFMVLRTKLGFKYFILQ